MKKNNKGFTLVELMAVIAVLAIIALIAYPLVTKTITNSKDKLSDEQKRTLEEAAKLYAIKNAPESCECVDVETLQSSGYLEDGDIKDPKGGTLNGCVAIKWNESSKQYSYTYGGSCN